MTRRRSDRRPRGRRPPGAWRRFLAAVAALVVLAAGVPMLLVVCSSVGLGASHPLPEIGTADEIRSFFERDLSPAEVAPIAMRGLIIVGWLLWLAMILSVLASILDAGGSRLRSWIPQFSMFAGLGRWIAAGLTAVTSLTPNLVSAAELVSPRPFTISSATPESPQVVERPVPLGHARVQRGESIELFAERTLGDASRWEEIWQLNRNQPVGQQGEVWTAAWKLGAGWDLLLPRDAPAQPVAAGARGTRPAVHSPTEAVDTVAAEPPAPPVSAAVEVVGQYEVVEGDSFWAIAERFLPDGAAERDVWTFTEALMNHNAPRLGYEHPAMLHPGDVIDVLAAPNSSAPDPETATHTVVPGDSYWGIAEGALPDDATQGDVLERTNELIDLNAPRLGYGDRQMIHPGDTVYLEPPSAPAVDAETAGGMSAEVSNDDPDSDAVEIGSLIAEGPSAPAPLPPPTTLPAPPPPTTSTTSTTSTIVPAAPDSDSTDQSAAEKPPSRSPIRIGQVALIATGIVALLAARRRARLRAAEPPARVPLPNPDTAATERALRRLDAPDRLLRVDISVRAVAAALADSDHRVLAVRSGPDGTVEVILTGPTTLGEPWTGDDRRWTLGSDVCVEDVADDARRVATPCIALVQLGVDEHGWDVLVDLEALELLAIDADATAADAIARGVAVGLASSEFAEVAQLIGVGLDPAAFLGHRQAHVVDSLDEGIELAATLIGTTSTTRRTTFSLRARHSGGEMWEPAVVIVANAAAGDVTDAVAASVTSRAGMAMVAASAVRGAAWTLRPDGAMWTLDPLGINLQPVGLEPEEVDELNELLDAATATESEPAPATTPVFASSPASVVEPSSDGHVAVVELTAASDPGLDLDAVAVPSELLTAASGPPSNGDHGHNGHERGQATSSSGQADFADPPWTMLVRLLGSVDVVNRDGDAVTFERSKTLELVSWLVTHRERATRVAARTALWDLDVRDATFANVVSEARRAMARQVPPPEGDEWLRRTLTDELSLHEEVIADVDLVAARLNASRSVTGATAMATLRPAVELVRDMPFAGTNYLWPDTEGIASNLVLLATNVTAEYAKLALAAGDADGVFWATGRGLKVIAGQEALIALRMRAHAEAGDLSGVRVEWEAYERVLNADPWSDGEPAPKLVALRKELLSR